MANHTTKVKVEVLLATYNGEKYLAEQLDSLLAQSDVIISLLVSDDGSQDKTLEILGSYKDLFHDFQLFQGPGQGPQSNFFFLLKQSTGEYVALCDQDDIWHTDHLINSIIRLNKSEDPALSFSAVSEFNTQNPAKLKVWPNQFLTDNIISTATENYARGCTMVMNRQAVKYFQSNIPTNAIMHDWWILIVIRGVGKIFWTPRPEIDYRIHQMNFVGPTPTTKQLIFRMWKFIIDPKLKIIQQAREVLELYKPLMTSHEAWKLEVWLLHASSPLNRKRARAVLWPERLKSNWSREIAFRIQLAVGYVDKH